MNLVLAAALTTLFPAYAVVRTPSGPVAPIVFPSTTVPVEIHDGAIPGVPAASVTALVRSSLTTWNAPVCSNLLLTEAALVSSSAHANDGKNRIVMKTQSWPGGADGAVATTIRTRNTGSTPQTWTDVDVLVNGVDYTFAIDGDVHRFDLGGILVHEVGHLVGLQHTPHPSATMYAAGDEGHTHARTLFPDDVKGLCFLYPAAAFTCSDDDDCPMFDAFYGGTDQRTRCENGACVQGAASYGAACFQQADCASGTCVNDPDGASSADPASCSQACVVGGASCPDGDFCTAQGGGLCVLGRDGCMFDSDCGGANDVCAQDLDGKRRCLHLCLQNAHCPPPEVCHGGTGANPPGFCRVPGPKTVGSECDDGSECASLGCGGTNAPPFCVEGANDAGVVVEPEPTPGEPEPTPGEPEPTPGEPEPSTGEPEPSVSEPEPSVNEPEPSDDGATPACRCAETSSTHGAGTAVVIAAASLTIRRRRRP